MKIIPSGIQNFIEFVIEAMYNTCKKIAGEEKGKIFFPLVMTIFLFIVVSNWIGVLPGTGTIGRIETAEEYCHHQKEKNNLGHDVDFNIYKRNGNLSSTLFGFGAAQYKIKSSDPSLFNHVNNEICSQDWLDLEFEKAKQIKAEELSTNNFDENYQAGILVPFFRGANSDINTTLALALCAMISIHFWAFRYLGFFGHMGKFINFKNGPINFFVGILELIGELAKIISFTFRLFGNIFAGEVLLFAMAFLLPLIGIIPFLGLELFVGLIQGLIFAMLTLIFASISTVEHNSDEH
jgi:F-type H+-transporting ATPase subunit a